MSVEAMPEGRKRRSGERPASPPAEVSRQFVLLVHGTFAASPQDEGDRWWQRGSRFSHWLAERLGKQGVTQLELGVFHWTGDNSARDRGEAAIDLARRLEALEARQQSYHLIGHSHGGLVIWGALCESVRRGRDLAHLASWATVGTPFLHPAFRGFDPWSPLSPSVSALALAYLTPFLLDYLRHFDELVADRRFLELVLLPLLWLLLAIVFTAGTVRLISQLVARQRARRAARISARAFDLYGPRWLGLWSSDDEAINGLRSSLWAGGRVIPAIAAGQRGLAARVLGAATAPLRWLYNRVIAPIGDDFVWSALTRRAWGSDVAWATVETVESTPSGDGRGWPALPPRVNQAMVELADGGTAAGVREMRRLLAAAGRSELDLMELIAESSARLGTTALVHTAYFDQPEVCELLALQILAAGGGAGAEEQGREGAGELGDWLAAGRSAGPADGAAGGGGAPRAAVRHGARFGAAREVAASCLVLVALAGASALAASVVTYTDRYQVDEILRSAPLDQASVALDPSLGLGVQPTDEVEQDPSPDELLGDWLAALIAAGETERAFAVAEGLTTATGEPDPRRRLTAMSRIYQELAIREDGLHLDGAAARIDVLVSQDEAADIDFTVYSPIVSRLIEAEEFTAAEATIERLRQRKPESWEALETGLVQGLVRAGRVDEAVAKLALYRAADPFQLAWAREWTASGRAAQGRIEEALALLAPMERLTLMTDAVPVLLARLRQAGRTVDLEALAGKAYASAEAGDTEQTRMFGGQAGRISVRMLSLAVDFAEADLPAWAERAAAGIGPRTGRREERLKEASLALARHGHADEALAVLDDLPDGEARLRAVSEVVDTLAKNGHSSAVAKAELLPIEGQEREVALVNASSDLAHHGLAEPALAAVFRLREITPGREDQLWRVGQELAQALPAERVLAAAAKLENPGDQTLLLLGAARALIRRLELDRAGAALARAAESAAAARAAGAQGPPAAPDVFSSEADGSEPYGRQGPVRYPVAGQQGKWTAAAVERALTLAAAAGSPTFAGREAAQLVRTEALALAAVGYALRGQTGKALSVARKLPEWRRHATFAEIAGILDRQGDAERAQQAAVAALPKSPFVESDLEPLLAGGLARYTYRPFLPRGGERSDLIWADDLLRTVARRIPFDDISAAEKLRHVRAAVAGIKSPDAQDDVLCDVAWTLAVQGSPEAAEILRLVRDPAKRSLSLIGLAQARGHPGAVAALEEETRQEQERRQQAGPLSFPTADAFRAAMLRARAEQPLLRRVRRLRLLRDRLGPAPPGHADEARRLIAEALAAGERIRGFEQRSQALAEAALELAHLRRFREARLTCEPCLPAHELMVYTAILRRYAEGETAPEA